MRPSRRYLLLAPAALLRAQTPPLLLIAAEGHGYHLGTLGTPGLRTPRLDLLADEGTLYTNACASSQLADQHPTAALNAVQPKETYTAALELFRAKPRVAVITLSGTIQNASFYSKQLNTHFNDETIRAILIKIDSPGGSTGSSKAIYRIIVHRDNPDVVIAAVGANSRPFKYAKVFSSGAINPARAPASMVILQTVIRSSIESARIASPANSTT